METTKSGLRQTRSGSDRLILSGKRPRSHPSPTDAQPLASRASRRTTTSRWKHSSGALVGHGAGVRREAEVGERATRVLRHEAVSQTPVCPVSLRHFWDAPELHRM